MTHNLSCPIISNKQIGDSDYHLISILSKGISRECKPGQFIMLGLKDDPGIFLRRPYSICGTWKTFEKSMRNSFHLLCKVVGKGSLALSKSKPGDEVTVLGPLGKPFNVESAGKRKNVRHLIVAGGIGSASFPFLISTLNRLGADPVMFYGGRKRVDLPLKSWFRSHCASLHLSTEDGSEGTKGLITALFEKYQTDRPEETVVFACGPPGMLKKVAEISQERGYSSYGSFEERMACGFGVCLGCAIPVKDGRDGAAYRHVCKDGPVFSMDEIDFHRI